MHEHLAYLEIDNLIFFMSYFSDLTETFQISRKFFL